MTSYTRRGIGRELPCEFIPACSQVIVEWEYDATLPRFLHMNVPAPEFFAPGDFWWDGRDGFRIVDGPVIFRDPSVTEAGPSALVVEADDLVPRLEKIGLRLIWTLLGEKRILGGPRDQRNHHGA